MRSPISRTPIVPISQEGNRKRTAFALRTGVGALKVLETFVLEALLANSYLLTEEETVCDELNGRIQEISASGVQSLPALWALSIAHPDLTHSLCLNSTSQLMPHLLLVIPLLVPLLHLDAPTSR